MELKWSSKILAFNPLSDASKTSQDFAIKLWHTFRALVDPISNLTIDLKCVGKDVTFNDTESKSLTQTWQVYVEFRARGEGWSDRIKGCHHQRSHFSGGTIWWRYWRKPSRWCRIMWGGMRQGRRRRFRRCWTGDPRGLSFPSPGNKGPVN